MDKIIDDSLFAESKSENSELILLNQIDFEKYNEGSYSYLFFKRILDIIFSITGMILLAPIFILVSVLIKLEDYKGPILFSQIRIGKNGKEFKMYKFRSMIVDAEEKLSDLKSYNEVQGAQFKIKNDPRITKVGKWIRATSIDELPQLINVLRGEMSLVGPRPALPNEVKEYDQEDKIRLIVTPGCTGLWQATVRNSVGFKEMVRLDLLYIENKKITYDILLIIMTIKSMLLMRGQ